MTQEWWYVSCTSNTNYTDSHKSSITDISYNAQSEKEALKVEWIQRVKSNISKNVVLYRFYDHSHFALSYVELTALTGAWLMTKEQIIKKIFKFHYIVYGLWLCFGFTQVHLQISIEECRPGKSCKSSSSGKFSVLQCPQNSVIRDNEWTEIYI